MKQKTNASQFPKMYYCRHMKDGICGYDEETILVNTPAVKKMMPSFEGKPVYVQHVDDVDLLNLELEADGYVTDTFYNELDGWVWSKFLVVGDAAHKAVAQHWAVSNAYVPLEVGRGGTKNNCPYDREIMNAEYTHLAIVPNPRYEEACIKTPEEFKTYQESLKRDLDELQNSKDKKPKGTNIMKFFKREKTEVEAPDMDSLTTIKNDDGTEREVTLQEMVDALQNAKKNEDKKGEYTDLMVNVGDEEMSVAELMNRYKKMNKKNADDEDDKMNMDDEDMDKKNMDDEDMDDKKNMDDKDEMENKKKAKKNSKGHFDALKNAHVKPHAHMNAIEIGCDKVARGKSRYGSDNK